MLYRLAKVFLNSRLKIAKKNLRLAFPELEESQVERILQESVKFWISSLLDIVTLRVFSKHWIQKYVEIEELPGLRSKIQQGCVIFSAHYGNFEILAQLSATIGSPVYFFAKPIKPAFLNYILKKLRQANGSIFVDHPKRAFKAIRKGASVGFLFDQHSPSKNSIASDFFKVRCLTSPVVWRLVQASRNNPIFCWITKEGFQHVVRWRDLEANNPYQLVSDLNHCLEAVIRKRPEQWWWFHRRWKTAIQYT